MYLVPPSEGPVVTATVTPFLGKVLLHKNS